MREGAERLLEVPHGLAVGRPRHGLLPRLPAVGQGLVPHLAPQGMVGQPFDLLGQPVAGERLEGLDDAGMERAPPLLQQAAVGHLVGEGVLEGVLELGEEARLVEELGRLEVREAAVQRRLGQLGNGLQQRQGHLRADDGGGLEQALLLRRQPVDARRQHRLHRGRHLQWSERLAPGDRRPARRPAPAVSTRVRTLSSRKKGLPSVRSIRSCLSGARLGSSPRRAWSSSSALAGGSGSSRSWV